jgi:multimeric flavodoxin WrbA
MILLKKYKGFMMKINIINGSQKIGESNTGIILDKFNEFVKNKHEVKNYKLSISLFAEEMYTEIISGDIIVLAFPLYIDSLPSNTLKMIIELESLFKEKNITGIIVYAIINNGFYEGKQTHIAFEIIKNWCERSGIKFGGGIGQGAGEMIGVTKNTPIDKGAFNNLARALKFMAEKIALKESFEIIYLSPYFPRFLWKIAGTSFWHQLAKKNGLKKKEITRKL